MHIGEKIKVKIKDSGLSITEFARRAGTTYQNLYKILKKDSIDSKYLEKFSEILNVPISIFFEKEGIETHIQKMDRSHIVAAFENFISVIMDELKK